MREKNLKIILVLELTTLLTVLIGLTMVSEGETLYVPLHEFLGASLGVLITTAGIYKIDQLT